MKIIITLILSSSISIAHAEEARIVIDENKRKEVIELFVEGKYEMYDSVEIRLYGVSDFYSIIDKVKNARGEDLHEAIVEIEREYTKSSKNVNLDKPFSKKSLPDLSDQLVAYLIENNRKDSLAEIKDYFDKLIALTRSENDKVATKALSILGHYCYQPDELTAEWMENQFYKTTRIGLNLTKIE